MGSALKRIKSSDLLGDQDLDALLADSPVEASRLRSEAVEQPEPTERPELAGQHEPPVGEMPEAAQQPEDAQKPKVVSRELDPVQANEGEARWEDLTGPGHQTAAAKQPDASLTEAVSPPGGEEEPLAVSASQDAHEWAARVPLPEALGTDEAPKTGGEQATPEGSVDRDLTPPDQEVAEASEVQMTAEPGWAGDAEDAWPDVTLPDQAMVAARAGSLGANAGVEMAATEPAGISPEENREEPSEDFADSPTTLHQQARSERAEPSSALDEEPVEMLDSDEIVVLEEEGGLEELVVEEAPLDAQADDYRGEPIVPKPPTPPPLRRDQALSDFEELSRGQTGRILEPPAVAVPGTDSPSGVQDNGLAADDKAVESDLSAAFASIRTDVRSTTGASETGPDQEEHRESVPAEQREPDASEKEALVQWDSESQPSSVGFVWELGELPQVERKVDVPQFDFDWDAKTNPNAGGTASSTSQPVTEIEMEAPGQGPEEHSDQSDLTVGSHPNAPAAEQSGQATEQPVEDQTKKSDQDGNKKKKKGLFKRLFRK